MQWRIFTKILRIRAWSECLPLAMCRKLLYARKIRERHEISWTPEFYIGTHAADKDTY